MSLLQKGINAFLFHIKNKFIRFVFVGGLNTAFGISVYCLMIWIGLSYVWATMISQVLGVLFNFMTTGRLVFENQDKRLIFKFILNYIFTYFVNVGINKASQLAFNCSAYTSGIIACLLTALISFFILSRFVYYKNQEHNEEN